MTKKKKHYAYFVPGGARGITEDWPVCEEIVKGTPGARYKAFAVREEAKDWLARGAVYAPRASADRPAPGPSRKPEKGIYFDAGTGRGAGVEISVTDEAGNNLLHKTLSRAKLNAFGKHLLADAAATNNYGELLALRHALKTAHKDGVKRIFGDSRLVIDYWSRWRIKRKDLPRATVKLADEVSELREAFEKAGGTVQRISGDHNPADLGFHR